MFLSKVTLNLRRHRTAFLLADLYAQHRFVMAAFPDGLLTEAGQKAEEGVQREGAQQKAGVLYRTEIGGTDERLQTAFLLVQSELEPDWERVAELHPDLICASLAKELRLTFAEGEGYRFRLRASPTICYTNRDEDGVRHPRRSGLFTELEQKAWLDRIAQRSGFEIDADRLLVTPLDRREGEKMGNKAGDKAGREREREHIRCFQVDFDGVLTVTEASTFTEAFRKGIGRGKAWGCGLLSLAKV